MEGHTGSPRWALQMQRRELRLRHNEQRMKRRELALRQHEKRIISQSKRAEQREHGFGKLESSKPVSDAELEPSSDLGKRLISKGYIPPDEKINLGSALVWAAETNLEEEVQLLIQQKADVNFVERKGKRQYRALHLAAWEGFCGIISILAGAGADLEGKTSNGSTALLYAVKYGQLDAIRLLVQLGANTTCRNKDGNGLLHIAAYYGHPEVVSLLCGRYMDVDVNVNDLNKDRQTPAYTSCYKGNFDVLKVLVRYHANITARDARSRTPLHEAARHGYAEIMEYLLKCGADPMAADLDGNTPLHDAAWFGKESSVQILLRYNVDVNTRNTLSERHSPLMAAAMAGCTEVVRLLIEHGADHRAADADGETLLHLAACFSHTSTIRFLVENEADIESRDCTKQTPLIGAATEGSMDSVRLLVGYKADLNAQDSEGGTSLHWAVAKRNKLLICYLIEQGADMEVADSHGMTVLVQAAARGDRDIVSLLLDSGADLAAKDKDGRTALHLAAKQGLETLVELLLNKGADPTAETAARERPEDLALRNRHSITANLLANLTTEQSKVFAVTNLVETAANGAIAQLARILDEDKEIINNLDLNGRSAISAAAEHGHCAVIGFLHKRGSLVDARDGNGETAIWWASRNGHLQVVQKLLELEASPELGDSDNHTPLCVAAQKGHGMVVSALLRSGGNVNAATTYGKAPLMFATESGNLQMVQLLIDNGAEVRYSHRGTAALSLAEAAGHKELAKLLQLDQATDKAADAQFKNAQKALSDALAEAAKLGQVAEILRLLQAGAEPNGKSSVKRPLILASKTGHAKAVEVLVDGNAGVDSADENNKTAISWAAAFNHLDIIRVLCKHGANIDHLNDANRTALWYAARHGKEKTVRLLIDLGAQKETRDNRFRTPLWVASAKGHMGVVEALLEHGSNIECADKDGNTPLIIAVMAGNWTLCDLFLRKGARMRMDWRNGRSPLTWAAQRGHESIVELLIEHEADLNHVSSDGRTPLILAAQAGHAMVVKILIEMSADIDFKDVYNRTAMSYAKELNHEPVVKLLSQTGKLRARSERALQRMEHDNVNKRMLYRYGPLREGFIRILELLPGRMGDIISFDLHHVELKNNRIPFDALSYEWKGKVGTVPVQCNQDRLLITPNCKAALEMLRDENHTRMLWVDAICINQEGKEERSAQVAMMASIYRTAKTVLMWLGKEEKSSELAFSSIPILAQAYEESQKDDANLKEKVLKQVANTMENKELVADGWTELARRSYFQRAWIFQEIILAGSRGLVMCGSLSSPWNAFNAALQSYIAWSDDYISLNWLLQDSIYEFEKQGHLTFATALLSMAELGCSDARDKVFATLGVVEPGTAPEADYAKTAQEIFLEANRSMVASSSRALYNNIRQMRTATQAYDQEAVEGLPSWAYDFTRPFFPANAPSKGAKTFADFILSSPTIIGTTLFVNGCVLDKIILAVAITKDHDTFDTLKPVVQAMKKLHRGIYDLYPSVGRSDLDTGNAQGGIQSFKETNGDALLAAIFEDQVSPGKKLYFGSYLTWKASQDDEVPGDLMSKPPPPYLKDRVAAWNAKSQEPKTFSLDVCRSMERSHRYGWNLIYTEKGYIGLSEGPKPCENTVVALMGELEHLIMLKKHTQGPDEWYERGDAVFLHGWNEHTIKTNMLKDIDENAEVARLEIR